MSKDKIERAAVMAIAVFVAWIAVNHFRLVNAKIEAMRKTVNCADPSAKPRQTEAK